MEQVPSDTPGAPTPRGRVVVALLLAGGLLLGAGGLAAPPGAERAPFPFVWRDVLLVNLLCALPLAVTCAASLTRRLPPVASLGLAALLFGIGVMPLTSREPPGRGGDGRPDRPGGAALRAGLALGLTTSAALLAVVVIGGWRAQGQRGLGRRSAAVAGLGAVVLVVVPWAYVRARCRHDAAKLGELLEQSRLGEARALANALLVFDPEGDWDGRPLPRVAETIDRAVRELEARVAAPLAAGAADDERLDRARYLAMLGRTDEALEALQPLRGTPAAPDADNLDATIREARGEWEAALGGYRSAEAGWRSRPPSGARAAGLLRATTGVAYCQRKLGRYAEAEAAYQQVLALSPTADSHFLLARFYEDTQQAEKARAHARRAMAISPSRYGQQGERLIRKLTVFHFGCLGVYSAEKDRPKAPFNPGVAVQGP